MAKTVSALQKDALEALCAKEAKRLERLKNRKFVPFRQLRIRFLLRRLSRYKKNAS